MKPIASLVFIFALFVCQQSLAQLDGGKNRFTHADTLRGTITPERAWWDAIYYNIQITPDYERKSIQGFNEITFKVVAPGKVMQIDLQEPLIIKEILWKNTPLKFTRDGNAFFAFFPTTLQI